MSAPKAGQGGGTRGNNDEAVYIGFSVGYAAHIHIGTNDDDNRIGGLMAREMTSKHYDESYFSWQRPIGEFGAWANLTKFQGFIAPTDRVLDFGCGGGYLLAALSCADRLGVEPNASAWPEGERIGVRIVGAPADVPDERADVVISNNALEHCRYPLLELEALFSKVRSGGKLVFVVPCESIRLKYRTNLPGNHLYGWSPMALGNLFTEAGFVVDESKPFIHK